LKILVMSLLRIGDIAMSAGVLRDLRAKYPEARIDLLLNQQCAQIAPLLPYVDRFIYFDRQRLQKGLGDATVPFFESYELLSELLETVGDENYDLSLNLTQNRLSGWLMGLIEAKQRIGLVLDQDGRASFNSNWFRYMNTQIDHDGTEVFHFNDIFRFALGLDEIQTARPIMKETDAGKADALAIAGETQHLVAVQMLSSDLKKDYPLPAYTAALATFATRHPEVTLAILAAPFEKERLQPVVDALVNDGHRAVLAVTSFEAAYSLLKRSKLTITLDTSIKHLAAAAGSPILEICLGSSDPYRTGADQNGAVILRSKEACAPCTHSKACHRESQFCATRVPPDAVALLASEVYSRRHFQLQAIAEEYSEEIEVLRVERNALGFWAAPSLTEPLSEASVGRWIDLLCRKMWIQGTKNQDSLSSTLGSEMLKLADFFKALHPKVSEIEWRHLLEDFERRAMDIEGRINGFKTGIRHLHGTYEDPKQMRDFVRSLMTFREKTRTSPLFASFKKALDQVIEDDVSPAFTRFRHIHDVVNEIENRTKIHLKILRAVRLQLDVEGSVESQEQL
jgi:ADP-heptose:LPS heptosyltransferase